MGYCDRAWLLVICTCDGALLGQGIVTRHCKRVFVVTETGHDVSSLLPGIVGYHDRE